MTPFDGFLITAVYMAMMGFTFGFFIWRADNKKSDVDGIFIILFGLFWPIALLTYLPYCLGEFIASKVK